MIDNRITSLLHLSCQDQYQALTMPIYQGSTFNQHQQSELEYTRVANPTRDFLQKQLAILDQAEASFALSSGLAALNTVLDLLNVGDELIIPLDFYAGLSFILQDYIAHKGIIIKQIDLQDIKTLAKAITPKTKMVLCESVSNPNLFIHPLKEIATYAQKHDICFVVDNSVLSSYALAPLDFGADITIQSATKYLNGHADVTAGVISVNKKYAKVIEKCIERLGYALDPFQSWLLSRSLKTLHLRMQAHKNNIEQLYAWLKENPLFKQVNYAGEMNRRHGYWLHENALSYGSLMTIECYSMKTLALFIKIASDYFPKTVSFGGVHSSMSHPAKMSHKSTDQLESIKLSVSELMLRLSIGCEPIDSTLSIFEQYAKEVKQ